MKRAFWMALAGGLLLVSGSVAQTGSFLTHGGPTGSPEALLDCAGFDLYQQPLDDLNFDTARSSDAETPFEVLEAIVDGGGTITTFGAEIEGVRSWGLDIVFPPAPCVESPTTAFDITFYTDAAGVPGTVVGQATDVVPTITNTGIPFAFTTINEYDFSFAPVDATGASWVSIVRQIGDVGCQWLWVDENLSGTYDDQSYQVGGGGIKDTDHAICLAAASASVIEIPTTSPVGLGLLLLLLVGGSIFVLRRRRQTS